MAVKSTRDSLQSVILFLAANPVGNSPLALEEECAAIERELRMTEGRDDFVFRSKWAITTDDMMRHLNELRPTIIHFSGHGCGADRERLGSAQQNGPPRGALTDNGLYVQDGRGQPQCINPRGLKMMVKAAATSARIVVLNACYSAEHADELGAVVDCVVGMRGTISDSAARSFAAAFYRALGNRRSVGNAVEQAAAALAAEQVPDEYLPCFRTRSGLDAARIFMNEPMVAPAANPRLTMFGRPARDVDPLSYRSTVSTPPRRRCYQQDDDAPWTQSLRVCAHRCARTARPTPPRARPRPGAGPAGR